MAGYNFTIEAAKRIATAVRKSEGERRHVSGKPNPSLQPGSSFWAMLTGPADIAGKFWDWVAVVPNPAGLPAAGISNTILATNAWKFSDPAVAGFGNAREANDNLGIAMGTVVMLTFVGYSIPAATSTAGTAVDGVNAADVAAADTSVPMYIFNFNVQAADFALPPHDHRDNANGGFAFSVFHPGTSVPQQSWAL